jgi:hypothetical protein
LDEISTEVDRYTEVFDQIEQALLAGDYEKVAALDEQAYTIIPGLFKRLEEVTHTAA